MTPNLLSLYNNGNTRVSIFEDGTKIREFEGTAYSDFPESIDLKITDYCDMGCKFCHEMSSIHGLHADTMDIYSIISELPAGVELAIGGGNPLAHPHLKEILFEIKSKGLMANITVNSGHIQKYAILIQELIVNELVKGIGVSINSNSFVNLKTIAALTENLVFHMIAGVHTIAQLKLLVNEFSNPKILVLGYKDFGLGKLYLSNNQPSVVKLLSEWRNLIQLYLPRAIIAFDNLAIQQLSIKRLIPENEWSELYMGDDFVHTMYVDAVKREYAPTSRSTARQSFDNMTVLEYFKNFRTTA